MGNQPHYIAPHLISVLCEMLGKRTFSFSISSEESVAVVVPEIAEPTYGLYTWPCAPVLAQYIWYNRSKFRGRTLLELSCGTALPGLLASKCGAVVHLSDNPENLRCLDNIKRSCELNKLEDIPVHGIKWGRIEGDLLSLPGLDYIISSDCFYSARDFEDIIVTIAYLLEKNSNSEFLFTYQERSSSRSIEHLLYKWNLSATCVPLSSFDGHLPNLAGSELPGNHTVKLFKIRSKSYEDKGD